VRASPTPQLEPVLAVMQINLNEAARLVRQTSRSMTVSIHPYVQISLAERGATEIEVVSTTKSDRNFSAKQGRIEFRRTFGYNSYWQDNFYATEQCIEVFQRQRIVSGKPTRQTE